MANQLNRRQFMRNSAAAAAALATGLAAAHKTHAGQSTKATSSKILNYNPDMEYRRCGKTGLMVSAVVLGGHWKRLVKIIGGKEAEGWMTEDIERTRLPEEPLRGRHPLHRTRHQLCRCLLP